jgi:hypothetical protein
VERYAGVGEIAAGAGARHPARLALWKSADAWGGTVSSGSDYPFADWVRTAFEAGEPITIQLADAQPGTATARLTELGRLSGTHELAGIGAPPF